VESVSRSRNVTLVARLLAMAMAVAVAGLPAVGLVVGFAISSSSTQAAAGRVMARVSNGMSNQWNATDEGANTTRDSAELVSSAAGDIQTLISRFRY